MENISLESSIWDLHIHTCMCPKASNEFKGMSIEDYLNKLLNIMHRYPDLRMISFTDHNRISGDVCQAFLEKEKNITLIPGVEVDAWPCGKNEGTDNNEYKHVIFYFDYHEFKYGRHDKMINEELKKAPIDFNRFLNFLITEIKVPFLISPHFMKQDKRGFEYNWDEVTTKKSIDKYIDQLFCFWETSSVTNISRAVEFLRDFDRGERVSIISFSDSNNFEKLESYLKRPKQYFNALPSFEGLRMVGSECRRISANKIFISEEQRGSYIGKIKHGDEDINFSPKLNAIIGGRGSGKSILLDSIESIVDTERLSLLLDNDDRVQYIKKQKNSVFDLNGNDLSAHSFKTDYYNQGYAQKLFSDKNSLKESYFADEFNKLQTFEPESIRTQMIQDMEYHPLKKENSSSNITSLSSKLKTFKDESDLKIKKLRKDKELEYTDAENTLKVLFKDRIVPKVLQSNKEISDAAINFITVVENAIKSTNDSISFANIGPMFTNKYNELCGQKNNDKKEKDKALSSFKAQLGSTFIDAINRVSLINSLLSIGERNYSQEDSVNSRGYENHQFVFRRNLSVQPVLDYLHDVFCDYFDAAKLAKEKINKKNISCLWNLILIFCFRPEEFLLDSKQLANMIDELSNLKNLKILKKSSILFFDGKAEKDLEKLSPGTRANLLMEYLVFKDTSIPILIDQPEDNIDSRTIYTVMTDWFTSLKVRRQVILATHDANLVVNADAENIIVCSQESDDHFNYCNGALESEGMIDNVSKILDGGKRALKRRILKYGDE